MEPFKVSLNQMNFDEEAFSNFDDLHSFSNLVSYDSDFKQDLSDGFPLRARRIEQYTVADSFHCSQANHMARVMDDSKMSVIGPPNFVAVAEDDKYDDAVKGVNSNSNVNKRIAADNMDASDSFKAFTETVEALALQKSVIGKKTVVPASADEVARVVAATKARLNRDIRHNSSDSSIDSMNQATGSRDAGLPLSSGGGGNAEQTKGASYVEVRDTSALPAAEFRAENSSSVKKTVSTSSGSNAGDVSCHDGDASPSVSSSKKSVDIDADLTNRRKNSGGIILDARRSTSKSDSANVPNVEHSVVLSATPGKQGTSASATSMPKEFEGKELIRISAKEISTATKKSQSSWFWSKSTNEAANSKQVSPKTPNTKSQESGDGGRENKHQKKSAKHQEQAEDGKVAPSAVETQQKHADSSVETKQKHADSSVETKQKQADSSIETQQKQMNSSSKFASSERSPAHDKLAVSEKSATSEKLATYDKLAAYDKPTAYNKSAELAAYDKLSAHDKSVTSDEGSTAQSVEAGISVQSSPLSSSSLSSEQHAVPSKPSDSGHSQLTTNTPQTIENVDQNTKVKTPGHIVSERFVSSSTTQESSSVKLPLKQNNHIQDQLNTSTVSTESLRNHTSISVNTSERYQLNTVSLSNKTKLTVIESEIYSRPALQTTTSVDGDKDGRAVLRQDSIDSTCSNSKDDLQARLRQILKEKVKLEGQVEVLEGESSVLLRERAELQSKVAALMQELQSREKSRVGLAGDRDALSADLETLRQNRARLEAVIIDAHKLLEEKDQELKALENDLDLARNADEKNLDQLKKFQVEMKSRDATIADLKAKITELYVEFQTTNQNRILVENEVGSLQGELKSMSAAKEWYKEQLQSSQREKSDLQSEVTRVKAEMISLGTAFERVKAENQRTKRQLTDSEQKSLNEKQTLARHLESIEADMLEREAAFAQLQKDRQTASISKDADGGETELSATLREDLNKATNDLKRSVGQVTLLQQEQTDLVKRLTLSQESILERDKKIESLEKNVVDIEALVKQLQLELSTRNEEIGRLEHDRTVLQVELRSAKEEKEVFDTSLRSLKDDMGVVEKSFRLMKQELLAKQMELERLKLEMGGKMEMTKLESTPTKSSSELFEIPPGFEFSPVHSIVKSLTKYQCSETQTDGEPDVVPTPELRDTYVKEINSGVLERLEAEKSAVKSQLVEVRQFLEKLECEKEQLSKNLVSAEQELVVVKERSLDLELRLQQSYEEKQKLEQGKGLDERRSVESVQMQSENQKEIVELQKENTDLKSTLGDLQRESHKEIAKQKTKVLKLGKQLESALKEHRESSRSHEQLVAELSQKLTVLEESNSRLEVELANAHQRAALDLDERITQTHEELKRVTEELEAVRSAKHTVELELNQLIVRNETEITEYRIRFTNLETELQSARTYIEERKAADEDTANLALELEREKGRLAGFLRTHSTLKEHASLLEANLASKESSVVQLSSEVEEELKMKDRQIQELNEQVHLLEESLAKEQHNTKDARKQLMTEKGNHIKVRRELEQLSANHGQVVLELELLRKELSTISDDMGKSKDDQVTQKMKIEELLTELKTVKLDRDRVLRELEDKAARDSTLQEQIQSFEWKLSQKVSEMEAAEVKAQIIDERRQTEANAINQSLMATANELFAVRDELTMTKHERAELKAKVTQLKQVLTSIIEKCTMATEAGKAITIQMIMNKEELEKLLEDSTTSGVQSKPLSFLQATLSGLRGEISCLQKQVNEHTSVVQTSSEAWKQLEAQVEDLRQVCKSSAAHRVASGKMLKTAEELSQLPPLTDIQLALQLPSTGPLVLPGNRVNIVKTTTSSTTSKIEIIEHDKTTKTDAQLSAS